MHWAISECSRLLWSNVYLFNDSASSIDKQKNMNEVNRFIEEGILQAIRNLLPVKSILRDSLQEDDDMIQVNMKDAEDKDEYEIKEPEPKESEAKEPEPKEPEPKESEPKESEPKESEQVVSEVKDPDIKELVDIKEVPNTVNVVKEPETLIIDTERSVGFTGIDSIFGTTGEAELKPMIEEGDDELKIIGDLEELNFEEIEDLDKPDSMSAPLAIGDYETL
jgi:hypothetical protein